MVLLIEMIRKICRVYFEKMYAEIAETKVLIKNYEVG